MPENYDYSADYNQTTDPTGVIESGTLAAINGSEIDRMIATAKRFARDITLFRKTAFALIVQDEEAAASCIYALPRGKEKNPETGLWEKKTITGPSARFAEIIAYSWKNCRFGARVIAEEDEFITAQGMFFDVENNTAVSYEVKRRIVDKDGNRYKPDMIGVTANAACSIALRNAVLKAIPQAVWKGLYAAAEKTIRGDVATLVTRRQTMVDLFKGFGLTATQVCGLLGVEGISGITVDHLTTLQGVLTALKEGEITVEQILAEASGQDRSTAAKGRETIDKLKQQYRKDATEPAPTTEAATGGSAPRGDAAGTGPNLDAESPEPLELTPPTPTTEALTDLTDAQAKLDAKRKKGGGKAGVPLDFP